MRFCRFRGRIQFPRRAQRRRRASTNFAPPWDTARHEARLQWGRSFGFDAESKRLQFVSAQATYNWDCCGVTMEYRSYTVANVRNENLFRFTFTLGNIGSFGSMRQQERLY